MTNFFESELFDPIDLCSCFEPIFDPPPEQVAAWNFSEPEPTLENSSLHIFLCTIARENESSFLSGGRTIRPF